MKLVTTKAKNIFDENFLTNFLTQFKDLHVQTSKGKTNRNCIQLSFTLEQICSIYIHVCAKWETNRIGGGGKKHSSISLLGWHHTVPFLHSFIFSGCKALCLIDNVPRV